MAAHRLPRVFTIPASQPFLPTLVDTLFSGELVEGFCPADDPLVLADATILLPTRRAVRALHDVFRHRPPPTDTSAAEAVSLLPTISAIGDIDEEPPVLNAREPLQLASVQSLMLAPAISAPHRRLALAQMIRDFGERLRAVAVRAGFDDLSPLPTSAAQSVLLADELAALMDAVEVEEIGWRGLADLVPDDYASYWGLTLEFLKIIIDQWPQYLKSKALMNPHLRRSLALRARAAQLRQSDSPRPIIAAGSTGSIAATAELLAAIAASPSGAVVLPGLNSRADDETWRAIRGKDDVPGTFSHPQYAMAHLLNHLGVDRARVQTLGPRPTTKARARLDFIEEAMRPAQTTERWATYRVDEAALDGIAVVEAQNEEEEALAIALCLREALEEGHTAALITPDRMLARRVAAALHRWNIVVDDSAGTPLADTPVGAFLLLIGEFITRDHTPQTLAALLKHPLFRLGRSAARARSEARLLELAILRGARAAPGLDGLCAAFKAAREHAGKPHRYPPIAHRMLTSRDWQAAARLLEDLRAILQPLEDLNHALAVPLARALDAHTRAAHHLSLDETGKTPQPGGIDAQVALAQFIESLHARDTDDMPAFAVRMDEYVDVLRALMGGIAVRPRAATENRIAIWGPLEARLQSADRVVLGGLNEGTWPNETRTDAWLSRGMRTRLGLLPPERQIGLAAHDVAQGLAAPQVVLTRALRVDNVPTVVSRWLQRLLALAGPQRARALRAAPNNRWLSWARQMDRRRRAQTIPVPDPKPCLEARPRRLSVSRIETLIHDPYAIYAQKILRLEPLEGFGQTPDAAMKGERIHDALARFAARWDKAFDGQAHAALLETGAEVFADLRAFPQVYGFWWPRFQRISDWYIAWEQARDADIAARLIEQSGAYTFDVDGRAFTLTARADRIDVTNNGAVSILDFKTGRIPSLAQVQKLQTPQLPLEALILLRGGFDGAPATDNLDALAYVQITGQSPAGNVLVRAAPDSTALDARALAMAAQEQLRALIERYNDPDQGYQPQVRPHPFSQHTGIYDHLARLQEWAQAREYGENS